MGDEIKLLLGISGLLKELRGREMRDSSSADGSKTGLDSE